MHKDDQMTPRQRASALKKGEAVDRYPISLFFGAPGHSLMGWDKYQEGASPRNIAAVRRKVYEVFGNDNAGVGYGLHGMAIALGAKMSDDPHVPSAILEHPLKDIHDQSMLHLETFTLQENAGIRTCFEAARILRDEIGDEIDVCMDFPGPITCASAIAGTPALLKGMLKSPTDIHQLLYFITTALIQMAEPFIKDGFTITISDPIASGSILSKKHFRSFVLPYSQRFIYSCMKLGAPPITGHICGDTTNLLEDLVECGYHALSLDNRVDLAVAKEKIGHLVGLIGNVDPVEKLYAGTTEDVRAAVRECMRKAWDSPKGYTIGVGCDSVYGVPLENVFAYMNEARKCAQYPLNPENFA